MKWLYTPFMLTLAFFYTKITFNDFMPPRSVGIISRAPAAEDLSCMEMTTKFYQDQSAEFIKSRIAANKDLHSFYRAFPPLFYLQFKDKKYNSVFAPLEKYRGTIGGDLHLENFGFVLTDKGKVIFGLNDFDDVAEAPLFYDLARHFVSAKIVEKKIGWNEYFAAYQKGLKGEAHTNSFYIEKGMEEVVEVAEKNFKKHVSSEAPFKFIKFKAPHRATDVNEVKDLERALKEKFPKIEIFDHYVRIKEDGGSAGLKRFQVLARVEPHAKVQWLDVKESAHSSYDKVLGTTGTSFEDRILALKEYIYNGGLDQSIDVLMIEEKPYSLRFVDQFSSSVKLDDLSEDDYADIILDQAYAIGKMHQLSLKEKVPSYEKQWEEVNKGQVEEVLIALKFRLKDLYQEK